MVVMVCTAGTGGIGTTENDTIIVCRIADDIPFGRGPRRIHMNKASVIVLDFGASYIADDGGDRVEEKGEDKCLSSCW